MLTSDQPDLAHDSIWCADARIRRRRIPQFRQSTFDRRRYHGSGLNATDLEFRNYNRSLTGFTGVVLSIDSGVFMFM